MGMNTVIVILNDHLSNIRDDADFGRKVYDAVAGWPHDKLAGCTAGFRIVSMAHADYDQLVRVGGNTGSPLEREEEEAVLRIRRKRQRARSNERRRE